MSDPIDVRQWNPSRLIRFLEENEQYGDDWNEEIRELKKLMDGEPAEKKK